MEILIYAIVLIILIWASYTDIKKTIIPNTAVVLIGLAGILLYWLKKGSITEYFFYFLYPSGILLLLSCIIDYFKKTKKTIWDPMIIVASMLVATLVNLSIEIKYIIFITLFIALQIIKDITLKEEENDNESIGGGDIKLIAVLGTVLQQHSIIFAIISMFMAFIFMKVKKTSNIYLAPFMAIAFITCILMKLGGI